MDIYWANLADEGSVNANLTLLWEEPISLKKHIAKTYFDFFKDTASKHHLLKCPSIKEETKNTFVVLSPIDLTINWDGVHTSTPDYDQHFFDQMINIKPCLDGTESRLMSINLHLVFFAEKKCIASMLPAYLSDTEFPKSAILPAGQMDLNSWFRPFDVLFFRSKNKSVIIKKGDPLYYIKLHTDENITFKRFAVNREITSILLQSVSVRQYTNLYNIENIYAIFNKSKIRNRIFKLIKQNLFN
jgi:hypothetical protein